MCTSRKKCVCVCVCVWITWTTLRYMFFSRVVQNIECLFQRMYDWHWEQAITLSLCFGRIIGQCLQSRWGYKKSWVLWSVLLSCNFCMPCFFCLENTFKLFQLPLHPVPSYHLPSLLTTITSCHVFYKFLLMSVKQFVLTFSHGFYYFLNIFPMARYLGTRFCLLNDLSLESE